MMRMDRQALERKLEHTRRIALEPTDPLTRERLAQMIEELEFQLQDKRKTARKLTTTVPPGQVERWNAALKVVNSW
jgi:TATA-binding protein-associated factor Taf7